MICNPASHSSPPGKLGTGWRWSVFPLGDVYGHLTASLMAAIDERPPHSRKIRPPWSLIKKAERRITVGTVGGARLIFQLAQFAAACCSSDSKNTKPRVPIVVLCASLSRWIWERLWKSKTWFKPGVLVSRMTTERKQVIRSSEEIVHATGTNFLLSIKFHISGA